MRRLKFPSGRIDTARWRALIAEWRAWRPIVRELPVSRTGTGRGYAFGGPSPDPDDA